MPQSLVQVYLHLVFSTKHRRPFLKDPSTRHRVHVYLAGACNNVACPVLEIGGVADHVHMLLRFSQGLTLQDFVRDLKRESSKWMKSQGPCGTDFHWQLGYGAFSISPAHAGALKSYIAAQESHHRGETFQDEFRRTCAKYGLEIDERFVWD